MTAARPENRAIKVDGTDSLARLKNLLARAREIDPKAQTEASRATNQGGSGAGDSVEVSHAVQEFERLSDLAAVTREIRRQLVMELRDEIASGGYNIDGTRIAAEMLREQRHLTVEPSDRSEES